MVCCRCNSMVSLLKSLLAVGAKRLCGPRRMKLQGSPCSKCGSPSWIVLLTRKGTAESWSLNSGSNLTCCSCGKNRVIGARALYFADVFAISASNLRRDSSSFKRNFFSSRAWHFSSMAISAVHSATLALTIATDEARLPRELARLESFES